METARQHFNIIINLFNKMLKKITIQFAISVGPTLAIEIVKAAIVMRDRIKFL